MPLEEERIPRILQVMNDLGTLSIHHDRAFFQEAYSRLNRAIYPMRMITPEYRFSNIFTEFKLGIIGVKDILTLLADTMAKKRVNDHYFYPDAYRFVANLEVDLSEREDKAQLLIAIKKMWHESIWLRKNLFLRAKEHLVYEETVWESNMQIVIGDIVEELIRLLPPYDQFHVIWDFLWRDMDEMVKLFDSGFISIQVNSLDEFFQVVPIINWAEKAGYHKEVVELREYVEGLYTTEQIEWKMVSPYFVSLAIEHLSNIYTDKSFIYAKAWFLFNQGIQHSEKHSGIASCYTALMKLLLNIDELDAAIEFWQGLPAQGKNELFQIQNHQLKDYAVLHHAVDKVENLKDFFLEHSEYYSTSSTLKRSLENREQIWGNSWLEAGLTMARQHKLAYPALYDVVLNNLHHIQSEQFFTILYVLLQTPETQEVYLPLMLTEINHIFAQINHGKFDIERSYRKVLDTFQWVLQLQDAGML